MTVQQKLCWLVGRLETQALYGTKVTVTGRDRTEWAKVAIPSQPTNRDPRGYRAGSHPSAHRHPPRQRPGVGGHPVPHRVAVEQLDQHRSRQGTHVMQVSYDTRLPVLRSTPAYAVVSLIGGRQVAVRRSDVVLHRWGTAWGVTRAKVVAEAQKFTGLQYLWAGTSGFGYDCSGFTYSLYHAYGRTLSRDADQQAVHGTAVARNSLLIGDLVFFRDSPSGPDRPRRHVRRWREHD